MRIVLSIAVFIGVMALADILLGIDPTLAEAIVVTIATTFMIITQESS